MIHLQIYKHYNWIKTKIYWKLFTKVLKNQAGLGLDKQNDSIRREAQAENRVSTK